MKWLSAVSEDVSGRWYRACPGCEKPIGWIEVLIRTTPRPVEPTQLSLFGEVAQALDVLSHPPPKWKTKIKPRCSMHGWIDWWIIIEKGNGVIGRSRMKPRRPKALTFALWPARPVRLWRATRPWVKKFMDERNKKKAARVLLIEGQNGSLKLEG